MDLGVGLSEGASMEDDQGDRMEVYGACIVAIVVPKETRLRLIISSGPGSKDKRLRSVVKLDIETSTMLAKGVRTPKIEGC